MSDEIQPTRTGLLTLLLRNKSGLTIDELASALTISRNAVRQHLTALERDGLVAVGDVRRSLGRPSQLYTLTPRGLDQFPKQYTLMSELVFDALMDLHGSEAIQTLLKQIADRLAVQYAGRIKGDTPGERTEAVAALLSELGYVAGVERNAQGTSITAVNCVYHHLAEQFPEVCGLDIDLIQQLLGSSVQHEECMVKGGHSCRFRIIDAAR